jgi:hypothetical protein
VTCKNIATSSFLERGKLPLVMENARSALELALRGAGFIREGEEKILRIRDTLHLSEFHASPALARELTAGGRCECIAEPGPIFDDAGELLPF